MLRRVSSVDSPSQKCCAARGAIGGRHRQHRDGAAPPAPPQKSHSRRVGERARRGAARGARHPAPAQITCCARSRTRSLALWLWRQRLQFAVRGQLPWEATAARITRPDGDCGAAYSRDGNAAGGGMRHYSPAGLTGADPTGGEVRRLQSRAATFSPLVSWRQNRHRQRHQVSSGDTNLGLVS